MGWSGRGVVRFLIALCACCAVVPPVAAQDAGKPVGMIIEITGAVSIKRGTTTDPAQLADLLFAGNEVSTSANGTVTFSFCPSNERVSLKAGSAAVVAASAIQQSRGAAAVRTAGMKCTLPQIALGKRDIEHIGVMAARGSPPIPLYLGGRITTARPMFMWVPVMTAQEYTLTLKDRGGQVLWTWNHTGQASEIRLPDDTAELPPGNYAWELTARANGRVTAQQSANFEVKPTDEFRAMNSPLELAAALEDAGYYSEAAAIYRGLRAQNATDSRFTRQLIWLYWNAGLFSASNDELQKKK
jgi:hypothetical protein